MTASSDTISAIKYRSDYRPSYFNIPSISLDFDLDLTATRVVNTMQIERCGESDALVLDGIDIKLESVELVDSDAQIDWQQESETLTINSLPYVCTLRIITLCDPQNNSALEGLYFAAGAYCTQCEAEGFRRITYFLDRPDVLSLYTVSITASKNDFPYLLSNGNKVSSEAVDDGKHRVVWEDPHPKPCYLFALVAGDFDLLEGAYTTASGRSVALQFFVEKGRQQQAQHALDSLKKSMRWDEETYGLEYDLDIYMVVATDFFNMGAMENKGLNVFNSKFILAQPDTATDEDYFNIESVVAHEYFHNWTGNRVTCRDWFQLSLKEGLTVFRDQQFSEDMTAPLSNRIKNINIMRAMQFAEDASAMSHPIRPDSVIEMNNFYTLTVYDKGAEVIRMQQTLLGESGFRRGMDLYLQRHDGQAVTCDDFVGAMQDANEYDMTHFKRWYAQSGTPQVTVKQHYDAQHQQLICEISQITHATHDQSDKQSLTIPLCYVCVDSAGRHYSARVQANQLNNHGDSRGANDADIVVLTEASQPVVFDNVSESAVALFNVGFSAPVNMHTDLSSEQWRQLFMQSEQPLACWEASQQVFTHIVTQVYAQALDIENADVAAQHMGFIVQWLDANQHNHELIAEVLSLPSMEQLINHIDNVDPIALLEARNKVENALATILAPSALLHYKQLHVAQAYVYNAKDMAKRKLANLLLRYICIAEQDASLATVQVNHANNMTDVLGGLKAAQSLADASFDDLMQEFVAQWQQDPVVLDKWFALHATSERDDILDQIVLLQSHPSFSINNPNKVRSLMGSFAFYNIKHFHSQAGYQFFTDFLLSYDKVNAQVAARLVTPLTQWQRYSDAYSRLMVEQLRRIIDHPNISKDVFEKVSKSLLQYEQSAA